MFCLILSHIFLLSEIFKLRRDFTFEFIFGALSPTMMYPHLHNKRCGCKAHIEKLWRIIRVIVAVRILICANWCSYFPGDCLTFEIRAPIC